jgi:hypothetical protein
MQVKELIVTGDATIVGNLNCKELEEKAPAYTYGTTDLTPGVSVLETGKLYFVYE